MRQVLAKLRDNFAAYGWIIRWHEPTPTWTADRGDQVLRRSDPIALRAALEVAKHTSYSTRAAEVSGNSTPRVERTPR